MRLLNRTHKGYTLLEILLVVAIIAASITLIYAMLKPASLKAGVEKEQGRLDQLVEGVQGSYGRTQGNFSGLNMLSLQGLRLDGAKISGTTESDLLMISSLGDEMHVAPAQVYAPNDAFDIIYRDLNRKKCINYINSFYPKSYNILVGASQTSVQQISGGSGGALKSEDIIITACNQAEFQQNAGTVTFRFYEKLSSDGSGPPPPVCGCSPQTQYRDEVCGPGQIGKISQTRSSDCSAGTPECPQPNWTPWTTTSNTCSGGPVGPPTDGNATNVADTCEPRIDTRNVPCPAATPYGQITERSNVTCSGTTEVQGPWLVTQNTCSPYQTPDSTCNPSTLTLPQACPAGQGGQITLQRSSTCASPFASPTWGPDVVVSSDCTPDCIAAGTCCRPTHSAPRTVNTCPAGMFGANTERQSSTCSSSTAVPAWGPWYILSSTCTLCPAPSTVSESRWIPATVACPAGYTGSHTLEREETRSLTTSYACPAGTAVLPPPTIVPTAWTLSGNTRNVVNTCAPANCSLKNGDVFNWTVGASSCQQAIFGPITVLHGSAFGAEDTFAPDVGNANFRCNNGVISFTTPEAGATCGPSACSVPAGQVFNWTVGGTACTYTAPSATSIGHGSNLTATDSTAPGTGTAPFACNNGTLSTTAGPGATCVPSACNVAKDTKFTWQEGTSNCEYTTTAPSLIASGSNYDATDSDLPLVGDASFACNNGTITPSSANPGATCKPANCNVSAGQVFNWTVGGKDCTSTSASGFMVANGALASFNDTIPAETGTGRFICNAGVLSQDPSSTCSTVSSCVPPSGPLTGTWERVNGSLNWPAGLGVYGNLSGGYADYVASNIGDYARANIVFPNISLNFAAIPPRPAAAVGPDLGLCSMSLANGASSGIIGTNRPVGSAGGTPISGPSGSCIVGEHIFLRAGETFCMNQTTNQICGVEWKCVPSATCTPPADSAPVAITRSAPDDVRYFDASGNQVASGGCMEQRRNRTENGTRVTTYSCPGPTGADNDTWLGTYNYTSDWWTLSNTCTSTCTPPTGPMNGVWKLKNTSTIDPYAGAPGNIETNIGDLARRNAMASQIGGNNSGTWSIYPFMASGCFNTSTGGGGTNANPMSPPTGACIVGEKITSRVWGPGHAYTGTVYNAGQTFFFECEAAPPSGTCYGWEMAYDVYGPGAACHSNPYAADSPSSNLKWVGGDANKWDPNNMVYFVPDGIVCGPDNVGAQIMVNSSCGGWQSNLEGSSFWRCSDGSRYDDPDPVYGPYQYRQSSGIVITHPDPTVAACD